jgi:sulfur-oxidizing protein SoxX
MRKTAKTLFGASAALLVAGLMASPAFAGKLPSDADCKKLEGADAVKKGACVAIDRTKGNCLACHVMADGALPGNIAPPLVAMKARFSDKAKLRAQLWDAGVANPNTIMPPFGRHKIVSEQDIDNMVEFLLTL